MTKNCIVVALMATVLLTVAPIAESQDQASAKKKKAAKGKKEWQKHIKKVMKTRQVSLNFRDTPIGDCVGFLRDITGLTFVIDPQSGVDANLGVTLKLKGISLENAVKLILAADPRYNYKLSHECVVFGTADSLKTLPVNPATPKNMNSKQKALWKKVKDKLITLNFNDTPFADVLDFLGMITGTKVTLEKGLKAKAVNLTGKSLSLPAVLGLIARHAKAEVGVAADGSALVLKKPSKTAAKKPANRPKTGN